MKPIRLRATTHKPAEKRTLTFKQASTLLPIAQPQFANIQCTSCIGFNVKSMNNMFINLTERHALGKLFTTCVSALPIFKYIHNQTLLLLPSSLHAIKAARAVITALGRGIASEFFFQQKKFQLFSFTKCPQSLRPSLQMRSADHVPLCSFSAPIVLCVLVCVIVFAFAIMQHVPPSSCDGIDQLLARQNYSATHGVHAH